MNFNQLAKSRRSVRDYSARAIARDDLETCVDSARFSPSACNVQPWKFIIIDDPETRKKVADTLSGPYQMNSFAKNAAAFIAIVSERQKLFPALGGTIRNTSFTFIDIGIATAHIVLAAEELGIGTCILGWFDEGKLKKILSVPRSRRIELLIAAGYPEKPVTRERRLKDKSEVISRNKY